MTKISDLTALTGAGVDAAADLLPIVDMSAAGAARNKNITVDEARIGLGLGTAASPQFTAINLGHASDTTISRVSAGVAAIEGVNIVTTAGGVTFAADIIVPDEAYDATAWNGSLEVPTKNAVRDKIESLSGGVTTLDGLSDVNAPTPSNNDVLTWDSTPGEWVPAAPTGGSNALDDLTDVDAPTPSDGDVLTFDSGSGDWVPEAPAGGGTPSGTSFPGSPSSGDLFYRTDRHIEYYYDGARWLSTQLFAANFPSATTAGFTADGIILRSAVPFKGTYSLWLENWQTVSILTATAIWNLDLAYADSANAKTIIASRSTSGDAANTWVNGSATINAQLSSNAFTLEFNPDETTGSATLSSFGFLTYRLIG